MEENSFAQKLGAEALGTAVLVFLGAGSVPALFLARGGEGGAPFTGAELFAISTAFGLAVVAMVYAIGKISGCHINPAVTLAMAFTQADAVEPRPVPYVVAQCVGATIGGLAIWGVFAHKVVRRRRRARRLRRRHRDRLGDAERGHRHRDPAVHDPRHRRQARRRRPAGRPRDRPDRDRHHHHRRPADRRRDQPGPLHRHADHRAARRPQPRLGTGLGLLGRPTSLGGLAGVLAYDLLAKPRQVAAAHRRERAVRAARSPRSPA